jgi:hypothetical protein
MKTGTSRLMDSHLVDYTNLNANNIKSSSTQLPHQEISDDRTKLHWKTSLVIHTPEISDDEIEKESWGYREVTKDMEIPPNEDWLGDNENGEPFWNINLQPKLTLNSEGKECYTIKSLK